MEIIPSGVYVRTERHRRILRETALKIKDNPGRFKKGHEVPGEWRESWRQKNRLKKTSKRLHQGYRLISEPGCKRDVAEHHIVWLRYNDWGLNYIPDGFVVHHKNLNRSDNRIENLVCIPRDYHSKAHRQLQLNNIGDDNMNQKDLQGRWR